MWHDFCNEAEAQKSYASARGLVSAVKTNWGWLKQQMDEIFWISPSWILVGVKK
jgi:hypothetical protein